MIWGIWSLASPHCSADSCSCLALYQKIIEFLVKSLPLQQEHWVYDPGKVEEVFTSWVAGLHCPASLTCIQDKLKLLREITCMMKTVRMIKTVHLSGSRFINTIAHYSQGKPNFEEFVVDGYSFFLVTTNLLLFNNNMHIYRWPAVWQQIIRFIFPVSLVSL